MAVDLSTMLGNVLLLIGEYKISNTHLLWLWRREACAYFHVHSLPRMCHAPKKAMQHWGMYNSAVFITIAMALDVVWRGKSLQEIPCMNSWTRFFQWKQLSMQSKVTMAHEGSVVHGMSLYVSIERMNVRSKTYCLDLIITELQVTIANADQQKQT